MFGKRRRRELREAPDADLDGLMTVFGQAATAWESIENPKTLVRARFADACRDAQVRPVTTTEFEQCWNGFEEEQQRRFCLFTAALDVDVVIRQLAVHAGREKKAERPLKLLQDLAVGLDLLTVSVVQHSDIRLEEFARHFCARWTLSIEGETASDSESRLNAIDFARLMRDAETARASAKDRLAYLAKLQEELEETRRPRRGKW